MKGIITEIINRTSIRNYKPLPIENDKIFRIIEAARLAPSAKNMQEWRFIVVTEKNLRLKLMTAANNQSFVGEAPVIIVCLSIMKDYVMRCGQIAYPIDIAIAISHMTLQAVKEGLGTCWIGSFYPDKVREILDIPFDIPVVELLTLGYPSKENNCNKKRKNLEDIFSFEKWSDKFYKDS